MKDVHVLGRHLQLIFTKSEQPTQCDIWVRDVMLTGREKFEIISTLEYSAVVCGDVEAVNENLVTSFTDIAKK